MPEITLPYNYEPRGYQLPVWQAFDSGIKRLFHVWHRRAGKDKTDINLCARASQQRVGAYYYFLPTYAQGKKIIWEGMDGNGFRFLHHFPQELWNGPPNNTEMKLRLTNGSIFQVIGSDNIDSIVGTNPVGVVFSEFALQDPKGWNYIRPILTENKGWAVFNGTPRGKNHFFDLYTKNKDNPRWFVEKKGIDETGVLTEADVDIERDSGMPEELCQQEYYCSFDAGLVGSLYADLLEEAEQDQRVGKKVKYDESKPVDTWWDIGVSKTDSTSIWFVQEYPGRTHVIDYRYGHGKALPHYVRLLNALPYIYRHHVGPWDVGHNEWASGSRKMVAANLGINFMDAPKLSLMDGINAVRMLLPNCWFDNNDNVKEGLDAMKSYHKPWNDQRGEFGWPPVHDWSSHGADAFRSGATGRRGAKIIRAKDRYQMNTGRARRSWMAA